MVKIICDQLHEWNRIVNLWWRYGPDILEYESYHMMNKPNVEYFTACVKNIRLFNVRTMTSSNNWHKWNLGHSMATHPFIVVITWCAYCHGNFDNDVPTPLSISRPCHAMLQTAACVCVCMCVCGCAGMKIQLTNVTGPYCWWVNNGSGNGLVPSGTKPLPESVLTKISDAIHCH